MIANLKNAIDIIDRAMVKSWVEDLVLCKTYVGLRFQESILKKVAATKKQSYRLATPQEESSGIDGYIGTRGVSIKPITYMAKNMLKEQIGVELIFYEKKKDGITIEFNF